MYSYQHLRTGFIVVKTEILSLGIAQEVETNTALLMNTVETIEWNIIRVENVEKLLSLVLTVPYRVVIYNILSEPPTHSEM